VPTPFRLDGSSPRQGRVQIPGIGVTPASRTPECSASNGACPGTRLAALSPPSSLASARAALSNPLLRTL
jgi:hypothetical protein